MRNANLTESEVCDMERREITSRLMHLKDAIEEAIDKTRYYQRAITVETLEVIRDDIHSILRTFQQ